MFDKTREGSIKTGGGRELGGGEIRGKGGKP